MPSSNDLIDEVLAIAQDCPLKEESVIRSNAALALARKRNIDRATEIANSINHPYTKSFAWIKIAGVTKLLVHQDYAQQLVSSFGGDHIENAFLHAHLAMLTRNSTHINRAFELIMKQNDQRAYTRLWRHAVMMFATIGEVARARVIAASLHDEMSKEVAFKEIAAVTGEWVDFDKIHPMFALEAHLDRRDLDGARDDVEKLDDPIEKARALYRVAALSGLPSDIDAAVELEGSDIHPMSLCDRGIAYARCGNIPEARRIAAQLGERAPDAEIRWIQTKVLLAIFDVEEVEQKPIS